MAYNPSLHTATNKPIGLVNKPVDARTYYFDAATYTYRPYTDVTEVLTYLNSAVDRVGHFSIIVDTVEYWFKDGVADADLIVKSNGGLTIDPIPLGSGDALEYDYTYPGDIQSKTLKIEGRQTKVSGRSGATVDVPYDLYYEINKATGHILLVRADTADVVTVYIVP
jgi:hypothetical protein